MGNRRVLLLNMFEALKAELGPSDWWPAEDPFEVAVGAILTQNTNWVNVEKALRNLRRRVCWTPAFARLVPGPIGRAHPACGLFPTQGRTPQTFLGVSQG